MTSGLKITILLSFISLFAMARQQEPNTADNKVKESQITQVFFNPGAQTLTGKEKAEIHGFVTSAMKNQKIKDVKILAWSDRVDVETLSAPKATQIKLAKARGQIIKKFLKDDLNVNASVHNMTENSKNISELLNKDNSHEEIDSASAVILVMFE